MTEGKNDAEARIANADRRLTRLAEKYAEKRPKDAEKIGRVRSRLVGEEPDSDDED